MASNGQFGHAAGDWVVHQAHQASVISDQDDYPAEHPYQDQAGLGLENLTINDTLPQARKKLKKKNKKKKQQDADVVAAWNSYFGPGDLADWARFCSDLGLEGDFSSKTKCKKAMKDVWINIHDFVYAEDKASVYKFATERELSAYTLQSNRTYPRSRIGKDDPLRLLLANILYPRYGKAKGKGKGKK